MEDFFFILLLILYIYDSFMCRKNSLFIYFCERRTASYLMGRLSIAADTLIPSG